MRERVLHRPQREPCDVVHGVAEVRELPVDDGGDVPVLVHEVARAGVALHEHDGLFVRGDVPLQPVEAEAHERVDAPVGAGRPAPHVGDLVAHVLGHGLHRTEARQGEVERVEAVEGGEVADEILRDAHLLVGVLDAIEPRLARDAFRQHRFVHRMHSERARDRDVGVLQRHEDLGLHAQRKEQAAGRLRHAAVAQEQRDVVAVALHVDEPRLAARAAWYPLRGRDASRPSLPRSIRRGRRGGRASRPPWSGRT